MIIVRGALWRSRQLIITIGDMDIKYYIYLDRDSGKTIAIKSKQQPKSREQSYIVYEWDLESRRYQMACFPEINPSLLVSKRFLFIGKIEIK